VHQAAADSLRCGRQQIFAGIGERRLSFPAAEQLEHGTAIQREHLGKPYAPVLTMAVQLLDGDAAPLTPADLLRMLACAATLLAVRCGRSQAQSLAQFLRHCVDREAFRGAVEATGRPGASIGAGRGRRPQVARPPSVIPRSWAD